MIKLKDLIKEVVEFESPEDSSVDYYEDLNRMEKESGINILSGKELTLIAVTNGKCVGALYTELSGDEFSFDVIVDKSERGRGIGKKLINFGLSEFKSLPEDYQLKLDVVNSDLVNHLLKRGLKITDKIGEHTIMTL